MEYEYKMVQMPATVDVEREYRKNKAAHFLEQMANEQAADGWEFHRVDKVGVINRPGIFARILGAQPMRVEYTVITFRREKYQATSEPASVPAASEPPGEIEGAPEPVVFPGEIEEGLVAGPEEPFAPPPAPRRYPAEPRPSEEHKHAA